LQQLRQLSVLVRSHGKLHGRQWQPSLTAPESFSTANDGPHSPLAQRMQDR
jgi:hypothetical protein